MAHYGHQGPFGGPPCACSCHNAGGGCDSFRSPCCDQPGPDQFMSSGEGPIKKSQSPREDLLDDGWRN